MVDPSRNGTRPTTDGPIGDIRGGCNRSATTIFRSIQARDEALAVVAPAEIADVNEVLVEQGRTLNEHLESQDWDPDAPRLDAQFERDLRDAQRAMETYADGNC